MGQVLTTVRAAVQDSDTKKQADDALNALLQLAETKQRLFYTQITSPNFDAALLPIDQVIQHEQVIRCKVTNDGTAIAGVLSDSFSDIVSGNMAKGITDVLKRALGVLLGSYSANSSTVTRYLVCTGALGGLTRIDVNLFMYNYTSSGLVDNIQNVLAISLVVSSIKTDTITDNTLRVIIQTCYGDSDAKTQKEIYQETRDILFPSAQSSTADDGSDAGLQGTSSYNPAIQQRIFRHCIKRAAADANGLIPKLTSNQVDIESKFTTIVNIGAGDESISGLESWVASWLKLRLPESTVAFVDIWSVLATTADPHIDTTVRVRVDNKVNKDDVDQQLDECLEELMKNCALPPVTILGYSVEGSDNDDEASLA